MYVYITTNPRTFNDCAATRTDFLLQILPVSPALLYSGVPTTINLDA